MDRFDDPRTTTKRKDDAWHDPRDTRMREIEVDEKKPQKALSLHELISQEAALASGLKREMAEISENGTLSEKNRLLPLVEREAFFEKKCAVMTKYQSEYNKAYEKYRRHLRHLDNEKTDHGKEMYSRGYDTGKSKGRQEMEEELEPVIDDLKRIRRMQRIAMGFITAYALFVTFAFFSVIMI